MTDRPIFVIGSARSGTSLMREFLRRHSRIFVPVEETDFVFRLLGNERTLKKLLATGTEGSVGMVLRQWAMVPKFREEGSWGSVPVAELISALTAAAAGGYEGRASTLVFDTLMETAMRRHGKERWGEKSPNHVFGLALLHDAYPEAVFVHTVRDGRAVTASLFKRFGGKRLADMLSCASRWKLAVRRVEAFRGRHPEVPIHSVRYEDIVENPARVVREVCGFLGEPYEPSMLEFSYSNSAYADVSSGPRSAAVYRESLDKWREILPSGWHSVLEDFLGREMKALNYTMSGVRDQRPIMPVRRSRCAANYAWMSTKAKIGAKAFLARTGYASVLRRIVGTDPNY